MKELIKRIPVVGPVARNAYRKLFHDNGPFQGSEQYWIDRYTAGGNSGDGSYDQLAEFKAEIINDFVKSNQIETLIEYGCGDGNQLTLAEYPSYIGFDVSPQAVQICEELFKNDSTKSFKLVSEYDSETAQVTLSLDVLYHLIEEEIFVAYLERLFDSSEKYVIVYSSDFEEEQRHHEKRREFTKWVETNRPDWKLHSYIPNRYPFNGLTGEGSLSDFYIYEKA